ncbi:MAG: DUF3794 domain-containing protein, partial [Clostridia bacterium]|nr:DUF3794 domain-containing protein [Clostridia bacterium]
EGKILCEVGLRLRTVAQRNETVSYTRDLYFPSVLAEVRRQELLLPKALRCLNGNFSLNTTLAQGGLAVAKDQRILEATATASAAELEGEHGKLFLKGSCHCQVLLSDEREITLQETDIPFRYALDGVSEDAVEDWDASLEVVSCRARADGERMAIDAEIAVSLSAYGKTRILTVEEVELGETVAADAAAYRICYPSREDSLWSVAKRYHCPIEALCLGNDLGGTAAADSPDSLAEKTYLLL